MVFKVKFLSTSLVFALALSTAACSIFGRSGESGYAKDRVSPNIVRKTSRIFRDGRNDQETERISQKTRLKQLENSLSTKKETEQYSKALPWFQTDEERIDFLRLPGFEARQKWLSERSFNQRTGQIKSRMRELVEAQDIAIGMPQNLVRQSWGDPDSIEVSGNPLFKNERWKYNRYVSTQEGYRPEKKIIYFEGGKVVAWELE